MWIDPRLSLHLLCLIVDRHDTHVGIAVYVHGLFVEYIDVKWITAGMKRFFGAQG